MAESVIILRADTDQAQGELEDLGKSFKDLGDDTSKASTKAESSLGKVEKGSDDARAAVKRLEDSSKKMGISLNTAANVASAAFNGMNAAMGTARMASDLFKKSLEGMFNQSEHGKELFEKLRVEFGQLIGKFAELLLGTTDVDEAFEKLSGAINIAIGAVDFAVDTFNIFYDILLRYNPVVIGLSAIMSSLGDVMAREAANTREWADVMAFGLDSISDSTRRATEATEGFQRALAERDLGVARADVAQLILANQGLSLSTTEGRATYRSLIETLSDGTDTFNTFRESQVAYLEESTFALDSTRTLGDAFGELSDAERFVVEGMMNLEDSLSGVGSIAGAAADEVEDASSRISSSFDGDVAEDATPFGIFTNLLAGSALGLNTIEGLFISELEQRQAFLEAKAQMERDAAEQGKLLMIEQAEFERTLTEGKAADAKRDNEARIAGNKAAAQAQAGFANQSIDALTAIVAGEEDAGKAFMRLIGQKLTAEGSSAIFKGGIELAFGNPQGLAGIAAGIAAVAAGSAITAGSVPSASNATAVGAGAAPPSSDRIQSVDNSSRTEVINHFSGLNTDPRGTARAVSDAMDDAKRYGMLKPAR